MGQAGQDIKQGSETVQNMIIAKDILSYKYYGLEGRIPWIHIGPLQSIVPIIPHRNQPI